MHRWMDGAKRERKAGAGFIFGIVFWVPIVLQSTVTIACVKPPLSTKAGLETGRGRGCRERGRGGVPQGDGWRFDYCCHAPAACQAQVL